MNHLDKDATTLGDWDRLDARTAFVGGAGPRRVKASRSNPARLFSCPDFNNTTRNEP